MSNTITIITELCAEDRARLDRILAALEQTTTHDAPVTAQEPQEEAQPSTHEETQPEPEVAPEPLPSKATATVTLADIQRKVVELSAAGKKDAVRGIVTKYATKVSAIPADKCDDVWAQLTELEG